MVYVVNDGLQIVAGGSGDNNLLSACFDVSHGLFLRGVEAGAFQNNVNIQLFTPGGYDQGSSSGNQYVLDAVTVKDGWGNEFYYYSPPPYQTYVLWSAGANEKTFPPWVPRDSLDSKANECVALWVEDDIINMSN
jgi:hypothetical protein